MSQTLGTGKYVVVTSAACMPNNCWGRYGKIAVIRRKTEAMPKIIADTAKFDVIKVWDRLNIGKGVRDAFSRGLEAALKLRDNLNAQYGAIANDPMIPREYTCPACGAETTEAWTGQGWHTAPHNDPQTDRTCE